MSLLAGSSASAPVTSVTQTSRTEQVGKAALIDRSLADCESSVQRRLGLPMGGLQPTKLPGGLHVARYLPQRLQKREQVGQLLTRELVVHALGHDRRGGLLKRFDGSARDASLNARSA